MYSLPTSDASASPSHAAALPLPSFHLSTRNLLNPLPTLRSSPIPLALHVSTADPTPLVLYTSRTPSTPTYHVHPSRLRTVPQSASITLSALSTARCPPTTIATATTSLAALMALPSGTHIPLGPRAHLVLIRKNPDPNPEAPVLSFDLFVAAAATRTSRRIAPRVRQNAVDVREHQGAHGLAMHDYGKDGCCAPDVDVDVTEVVRPRASTFVVPPRAVGALTSRLSNAGEMSRGRSGHADSDALPAKRSSVPILRLGAGSKTFLFRRSRQGPHSTTSRGTALA